MNDRKIFEGEIGKIKEFQYGISTIKLLKNKTATYSIFKIASMYSEEVLTVEKYPILCKLLKIDKPISVREYFDDFKLKYGYFQEWSDRHFIILDVSEIKIKKVSKESK